MRKDTKMKTTIDRIWMIVVGGLLGFLVMSTILPIRWEYTTKMVEDCGDPVAELTSYGEDGWALASALERRSGVCSVLLKRKTGL